MLAVGSGGLNARQGDIGEELERKVVHTRQAYAPAGETPVCCDKRTMLASGLRSRCNLNSSPPRMSLKVG